VTNRTIKQSLVLGVLACAAPLVVAAETHATHAKHPVHVGYSYTQTSTTARTADGHTRTTVRTDAQGRTSTREAQVTNDPAAGTRDRDVTYTGPNGAVRTVSNTTTRTDSGYARDTVVTKASGATVTREVGVVRDPQTHTWTKSVDVEHNKAP